MCTITAGLKRETLVVTMNRDEQRTRGKEISPQINTHLGQRFFAPLDSEQGGTWIGINMSGDIACLMNYYSSNSMIEPKQAQSRGSLIPKVLTCSDPKKLLENLPLEESFNGFTLLYFKDQDIKEFTWTGEELICQNYNLKNEKGGWILFTSSSFEEELVKQKREKYFEQWVDTGAKHTRQNLLPEIHEIVFESDPQRSFLIEREHSVTRSITQISKPLGKGGSSARISYWPDPIKNLDHFNLMNLRSSFIPPRAKETRT